MAFSGLTSLEIFYLLKELKELEESRVDQVYYPEKDYFIFQFYSPKLKKIYLHIYLPNYIFISRKKGDMPQPKGFCMYLRKNFKLKRIKEINQLGCERVIELVFDDKKIILEFFGNGNLIVTDADDKILSMKNKSSVFKMGDYYKKSDEMFDWKNIDEESFKRRCLSYKDNIGKFMSVKIGLGKKYADEVLFRASINPEKMSENISADEFNKIINVLEEIKQQNIRPFASKKMLSPFLFESEMNYDLGFVNFNALLNYLFSLEHKDTFQIKKESKIEKKRKQLENIIKKQKQAYEKSVKKEEENRIKGDKIYENFNKIETILNEVNSSIEEIGWEETAKKLKDGEVVKRVDKKNKKIVLDL